MLSVAAALRPYALCGPNACKFRMGVPRPHPAGASWRGRPGRRTGEERTTAVMALLSGKATVDQLAARFGVHGEVIEKWRALALDAVAAVMRQGSSRSSRESDLEKKLKSLERAFAELAIRHEVERCHVAALIINGPEGTPDPG